MQLLMPPPLTEPLADAVTCSAYVGAVLYPAETLAGAAGMLNAQGLVEPEQLPDQVSIVAVPVGVAVKLTAVPAARFTEHVPGQLIPLPLTVPPEEVTLSA